MKRTKKLQKDKIEEARARLKTFNLFLLNKRAQKIKQTQEIMSPKIKKISQAEFEAKASQLIENEKNNKKYAEKKQSIDLQEEQQKLINQQYIHVLWGEAFKEKINDLEIFNSIAEKGMLPNDLLMQKAKNIGIDLNEFNSFGFDKSNEVVYTGLIQYKNSDESADSYQPYAACCIKKENKEENTIINATFETESIQKDNSIQSHDEL